jgi:ribosomal protein S19
MGIRSNWKLNNVDKSMFKKILLLKVNNKLSGYNRIVFKKSNIVTKYFVNHKLLVYKGCFYRSFIITRFLLGYRFGEFAYTRKPFRYMLKAKKKK